MSAPTYEESRIAGAAALYSAPMWDTVAHEKRGLHPKDCNQACWDVAVDAVLKAVHLSELLDLVTAAETADDREVYTALVAYKRALRDDSNTVGPREMTKGEGT